jgi:antitoxin HicB
MNQNRKVQREPLEYYLLLKYPMSLYPEKDGGYTVILPDLPGCLAQGDTLEKALENINEARELWIEAVYRSHKKTIHSPSKMKV